MNHQVSAMKGKSSSQKQIIRTSQKTQRNACPANRPRRWNLSSPLTDRPQVLSFDKKIGKVLNNNMIASRTRKDALIEDLHASHPGSWGMVCMAQHCWWPYMNRDLLVHAIECKTCTAIGKI